VSGVRRRDVVVAMAAIPLLRARWEASLPARPSARPPVAFFTPVEMETVRVLSDLIVPRDDRSGSATDAGVPEFLDFVMTEWPAHQTPIRGGLAWLDRESTHRFGKPFRESAGGEQAALLDEIAYPARARPRMKAGVEFFNHFRDLVLSGFYSSKEGVKDLGYMGNTFVAEWRGCPE